MIYEELQKANVERSIRLYGKLVCGICGEEIIDNGLKWSKCNWNIDHIKPTSKGGANTMENTQLAHRACNSLKADN